MARRRAEDQPPTPATATDDAPTFFQQRMQQLANDYRPDGRPEPLSAVEIAAKTGVSIQYVKNLFRGTQDNPTKDIMTALCRAFPGLTLNYFVDPAQLPAQVRDSVEQETQASADLALAQRLRRAGVINAAARLGELDSDSLALAVEMIEGLGKRGERKSRLPGTS